MYVTDVIKWVFNDLQGREVRVPAVHVAALGDHQARHRPHLAPRSGQERAGEFDPIYYIDLFPNSQEVAGKSKI